MAFRIPKAAQEEARRGLAWVEEFGRGGTSVGRSSARRLADGGEATEEFVRKVARYFPRHEVDKEAEGFRPGEEGYPSNGRIAWALWGGDPGRDWSRAIVERLDGEKTMNHQTMSFGFDAVEVKTVTKNGAEVGVIKGYASTWDVDRGGDQIKRGAFKETLRDHKGRGRPIRMLWQHSSAELIGGFDPASAKEDERGLYVEGEINLETQRGREAYALAKQGVLADFSIGFRVRDYEIKRDLRIIKDIELFEVSLVSEPMNPKATLTEVKNLPDDLPVAALSHPWDEDGARERAPEGKGFCDLVDGKLTVIPRGLFAAAAAIKAGVADLSDEEEETACVEIERYYKRLGRQSPFEKGLGLDELKALSLSDIEALLRRGGLNARAAKRFVDLYAGAAPGVAGDAGSVEENALLKALSELTTDMKGLSRV